MKAPDKIYLQVCGECNLKGSDCKKCKFDSEVTTWCEDKIFDRDVEYIRKDAFINKACSWLKENKDKYLYNIGERDEYIPTCSDKMIEDFRNYLKAE